MTKYQSAIQWIAENDDTIWLDDIPSIPSVTACLVADIFQKTEEQVINDIRKYKEKQ